MARTSSAPRLATLDPREVGDGVARRALDHAVHLLITIDPRATWQADPPYLLAHTARLLTAYAQRGLAATDWQDHGCASDAVLDVCSALYTRAGDERSQLGAGVLDTTAEDPEDPIAIVLLAAHARIRIDQRQAVPVRELAALASVSADYVRQLSKAGELALSGRGGTLTATAAVARRWLTSRGLEV